MSFGQREGSVLEVVVDAVDVSPADGAALVLLEQLAAAPVAAEAVAGLAVPQDGTSWAHQAHGAGVLHTSHFLGRPARPRFEQVPQLLTRSFAADRRLWRRLWRLLWRLL